jgi:NET1-associated nuclear protein 1 (U3 small nucleolar RNA-associated protein 17)
MVLSVAELKPTANIAGIQTSVIDSGEIVESQVRRLEEERDGQPFVQRTPAVISLANPSQLLVGVGQTQEISPSNPLVSSVPYLQIFDLGSGNNVSRQTLTRSNETNVNITPTAHRISEPRVIHMKVSFDGKWLATVDEWTPPKRDVDFIGHQGKDLDDERRRRREVYLKFWHWGNDNDAWELVSRIDVPHTLSGSSYGAGRVLDLAADPSSPRFSTLGEDGIVRIWSMKTRKRDGVVVRGKNGQALRNWDCQHSISIGKPELYISSEKQKYPANGCVAFSEDGSLLAAACGDDGLLHLLDPESGVIRVTQSGLFDGDIINAEFLGQDLITLSDNLQLYDVVSEEVRYSIKLGKSVRNLSVSQKNEMMHLAVDWKSRTFAIALPGNFNGRSDQSLLSTSGELAIFEQDNQEPVLEQSFPNLITSLLPAVGSDGYLVLDASAELRTASRKGSQAVTTQAQSTSALQLDKVEESNGDLLRLVEDEVEEVEDVLPSSQTLDVDNEDDETPVVTQQQLTKIFDVGPSFALPPMDELFYQVAELFISKPLAQSLI